MNTLPREITLTAIFFPVRAASNFSVGVNFLSAKAVLLCKMIAKIKSYRYIHSSFIPEFLKWILQSLNLVRTIVPNRVRPLFGTMVLTRFKINRIANNVDPDETPRYELSPLALQCLHRLLYQSTGLYGVNK